MDTRLKLTRRSAVGLFLTPVVLSAGSLASASILPRGRVSISCDMPYWDPKGEGEAFPIRKSKEKPRMAATSAVDWNECLI